MVITIYAHLAEDVRKRLERLEAKAKRYGVPFSYSVGVPHVISYREESLDNAAHCVRRSAEAHYAEVVDMTISEEAICSNGWEVVAKIDHNDNGEGGYNNCVFWLDGVDHGTTYAHAAPHCDHCNTDRRRSTTYLVKRGEELRQVGASCLHDYTGILPWLAVAFAEFSTLAVEEGETYDPEIVAGSVVTATEEILACAVASVRKNGYANSESRRPTKWEMLEETPTDSDRKTAADIIDFFQNLDTEGDNFASNTRAVICSTYCKPKVYGFIAYAPRFYEKEMAKRAREAARKAKHEAEAAASAYFGEVGQRVTIHAEKIEVVASWFTNYSYYGESVYLYKIHATESGVFMWKTSTPIDEDERNKPHAIKATIKAHNDYNGVRQTVLTRCKITD